MPCIPLKDGWLTIVGEYKPGDPAPSGYMDKAEWAKVQLKAGLRQRRCSRCGLLCFPQEMVESGKCLECESE